MPVFTGNLYLKIDVTKNMFFFDDKPNIRILFLIRFILYDIIELMRFSSKVRKKTANR